MAEHGRAQENHGCWSASITIWKAEGAEMSSANNNNMTFSEFERLLDVYGSDRARWPVEARACAGQLVARDRSARRLLAEAEALDRALERAPLPSLAREAALADRILATARRSPRIVARSKADQADPVAPAARSAGNVVQLAPLRAPGRRWLPRTAFGGAAGALRWLWE
jgi:hypothetical protein